MKRTPLTGVHHLAVLVDDLEQAESFYVGVLGLTVERRWEDDAGGTRSVWVRAGLQLVMLERTQDAGRRPEGGGGWHLLALQIEPGERDAWRGALSAAGVAIERESDFSLFFRDPEGNRLAFSHWPEPQP